MRRAESLVDKRLNRGKQASVQVLLTGPSAAGKSTLALLLEKRGWERLDGDHLAKSLYVPGSPLLRAMVKEFGGNILFSDASLDSQKLSEIVFPSAKKREALNHLVYKPFLKALRARVRAARAARRPWLAEVPVYFDMGAPRLGVPVVLVTAPLGERVKRLRALGLSRAMAGARARALRFGPGERRRADLVLDGRKAPGALLDDFEMGLAAVRARRAEGGRL